MEITEANPVWSPDGNFIAYVTWSPEGGNIYKVNTAGRSKPVKLTNTSAIYQQLAWSYNSNRLVFIKGSTQNYQDAIGPFARGSLAELGWISTNGGNTNFIDKTNGRRGPHFVKGNDRIYLYQGGKDGKGLVSIRWDGSDDKAQVKVTGLKTFGAKDASTASFVKMAPDGDQALAQVSNDIYVVTVPYVGGDTPKISVADPSKA